VSDYKETEWRKIVASAESNINGDCPLIEDEAIVWADARIVELEKKLTNSKESVKRNADRIVERDAKIAELETENHSLNQLFAQRHEAGIRATKRWRKDNPGHYWTIPDLADCEVFLMDKVLELEKELQIAMLNSADRKGNDIKINIKLEPE
jgi:hypothetical protein